MFKLIGVALIGIVVVVLLRTAKPEFAVIAVIATGVVMVAIILSTLQNAILAFDEIVEKSGISDGVFSAVLKIIGIGYLTEYSSSIALDADCKSIASKLQFGGKLVIFMLSVSIITELINTLSNMLKII